MCREFRAHRCAVGTPEVGAAGPQLPLRTFDVCVCVCGQGVIFGLAQARLEPKGVDGPQRETPP